MSEEWDEGRIFDRFLARFPVKFEDSRNDFGTDVFLRDISAEGAKLMTRQKLLINDNVSLQVKLPDGYEGMTLNGQVMWAKTENSRVFDIGLRFHKVSLMALQRLFGFCVDVE